MIHTLIEKDRLGDRSPEKDCCYWLTFRQPVRKPSSESSGSVCQLKIQKPWWAIRAIHVEIECLCCRCPMQRWIMCTFNLQDKTGLKYPSTSFVDDTMLNWLLGNSEKCDTWTWNWTWWTDKLTLLNSSLWTEVNSTLGKRRNRKSLFYCDVLARCRL